MSETAASSGVSGKRENGFLKFIAYLQIIGIVLVVFGHSFHEYPDGEHGTGLLIYRMCYNFRMPLFLFVSGFLMVYTTFRRGDGFPSPVRFTLKKAKRLLIPYAVLTLVTYIPRASLSGLADDSLELSARGMIESLYITERLPIPFFWFLQASFLLLTVNYALIAVARHRRIHPALVYGGVILVFAGAQFVEQPSVEIFGINSVMRLGVYFALGAAYCEFYDRINRWLPLDSGRWAVVTAAAWLGLFLTGEHTWLYQVASVFGIAMCVCAAKLLVKHDVRILDHLIGANYIIFLLSWYFNVATQQVLSHYVSLPWWVHTILSLTFGLYIPWLFYRYMRRNIHRRPVRIIAFLLGQSFKSK